MLDKLAKTSEREPEPWPPGVSRTPTMSIGVVVEALKAEFPALTASKLRFFDDQGLVSPARTGSGYRKYSQADVERLRYVLSVQRDQLSPLSLIATQLEELDSGREVAPVEPSARIISVAGQTVRPAAGTTVTLREICDLVGVKESVVHSIIDDGLIAPLSSGRFDAGCVRTVECIKKLMARGVRGSNLRATKAAATRAADLINVAIAPIAAQRSPAAGERAQAQAQEMAQGLAELYREFLGAQLRDHA